MLLLHKTPRWSPQKLAPTALPDARTGVTAKVPVAKFTRANSEYFTAASAAWNKFNGSDMTICAWLRQTDNNTSATVSKKDSASTIEYVAYWQGAFKFYVSHNGSTTSTSAVSTQATSLNTWYLMVFRHRTGVSISIQAYGLEGEQTVAHTTGMYDGTAGLKVATELSTPSNYSGVDVANLVLVDEILTDADIAELYGDGTNFPLFTELSSALQTKLDNGAAFFPLSEHSTAAGAVTRKSYDQANSLTDNNTVPSVQGPRDAVAAGVQGMVSTETDSLGVTLVQATAANQPLWVPNSGQPYYQSTATTHHLRQGSDGVGDYERTTAFSAMCCAYLTSAAAEASLFSKFDTVGWSFGIDSSGRLELILRNTATTNEVRVRHASAPSTGAWHTFGFSYDGTSLVAGVVLYVDGAAVANTSVVDNLSATIGNSVGFQLFGRNGANSAIIGRIAHAPAIIPGAKPAADFARYHRAMKRRNPSFGLA